ncbi:MAG: translation initiation factor IF-2 N-terminal domain-containing protein, partial [Desulfovibrio sp.]|nr:translation initiation factor IF-2 N-terminal domain-containing protein [Desulfovibrio sp.]
MPEEKCKIKDIAVELEVQPKEMLRALREIGLPAKSTAGSISREDVARVRDYFSAQKHLNIERTEIRSDIIVRRHRGKRNAEIRIDGSDQIETDGFPPSAAPEAKPDLTPPQELDKSDLQADKRAKTRKMPSDTATAASPTSLPDAEKDGKKARQRSSRSKDVAAASSPARVISRPKIKGAEIPAPDAPPGAPGAESITTGDLQGKPPKNLRLALPDASAIPDAVSAPALSTRAMELDVRTASAAENESRSGAAAAARRMPPQTPRVKVISRPEPTEQEKRAGQAPGRRPAAQHDAGARPDNKRAQRAGR